MSLFLSSTSHSMAQKTTDIERNSEAIISKIDDGEYKNIDGFIVWQNDKLITENYWESWDRDKPHNLQSVTKSITSLLIGIAIQQEYIKNIDQKIIPFFPNYKIPSNDSLKNKITIENLLAMQAGMDWNEHPYSGSQLDGMNSTKNDWISFVLDIPMKNSPGESYNYNSGGTILLAGILEKASGNSVQEFADDYLFNPLDIKSAKWWFKDNRGLPHTGGGLSMAAKDMLKIGRLILQCGKWNDIQILSCGYINRLFVNHQEKPIPKVSEFRRGYSLLWHVFPLNHKNKSNHFQNNFIAAWGAEGQWIIVVPQHNLVTVFIASTDNYQQEVKPIEIVYQYLLK